MPVSVCCCYTTYVVTSQQTGKRSRKSLPPFPAGAGTLPPLVPDLSGVLLDATLGSPPRAPSRGCSRGGSAFAATPLCRVLAPDPSFDVPVGPADPSATRHWSSCPASRKPTRAVYTTHHNPPGCGASVQDDGMALSAAVPCDPGSRVSVRLCADAEFCSWLQSIKIELVIP